MRAHFFLCPLLLILLVLGLSPQTSAAEPEFPLTEDSKPQGIVPKGEMIKDSFTSTGDIFPGTQREYQLYLPHGLDRSKPAAFMVFQDGVIYQAPVVFDNLIAKKEIPPLIGVFIKPGVVPAANENALPRFNRSYEYDSITDNYARFLIGEFFPAIEAKHGIMLSKDPNDAAISGNSSGGIASFMVAWHRPDRFRRVFTGVGTYVGIHGGDQLPVLVRKYEPKPIKIFLQSGTGDNNLYCGDWWMANQMMERSFTWAGYEVNHAWGEGGHNGKHATQIFPDVLRWLWKGWQTNKEIKVNPMGASKWKGYEVLGVGEWNEALYEPAKDEFTPSTLTHEMAATADGSIYVHKRGAEKGVVTFVRLDASGGKQEITTRATDRMNGFKAGPDGCLRLFFSSNGEPKPARIVDMTPDGKVVREISFQDTTKEFGPPATNHAGICCDNSGRLYFSDAGDALIGRVDRDGTYQYLHGKDLKSDVLGGSAHVICLSPDQTLLYVADQGQVDCFQIHAEPPFFRYDQHFCLMENPRGLPFPEQPRALCVDTNGWLYVATTLGIQVCDQAGRVNFVIPTPHQPYDVCFGGKDLSELFIACWDRKYETHIYKRPTNARGVVSGQMAPIKPAAPKL